ncbi:DUF6602 domain-containing protein [Herbaspirillum hiltneri]|uniref:DUF6602 domain-containing protein n=1 Tax=Herbaspirillum hiltneri TaxID=341045 RepID=UPI000AE3805B|nr:DUF6602 domain-containing protein [Herbaspirillum hiltneri]
MLRNKSPLETLALSTAEKFRKDYVDLSRMLFASDQARNGLHHPGEFGRYRENLIRKLLASFLPARLGIGDGFVVSTDGSTSSQCDIVLFERDATPLLEIAGGRALYPVETCVGIGEVKSVLDFSDLKLCLSKLMDVKKIRHQMTPFGLPVAPIDAVAAVALMASNGEKDEILGEMFNERIFIENLVENNFNPDYYEQHNLVSFLVCEKINWPANCGPTSRRFGETLNDLYEPRLKDFPIRHNFILSIEDGFLSYYFTQEDASGEVRSIPYSFPRHEESDCGWRWLSADNDNQHILTFAAEMAIAASATWVYQFSSKAHSTSPRGFEFQFYPLS